MSSFTMDFNLDTDPMARQIERVKNHVDGTTTAVVAMQTAVIAAESEAADHVCYNINRGFHTLIRSQISQKIARHTSEIEAKIIEMSQQSIALNNIKNRMTKDYHMISSRYTKLFNSINASLKQQIFELDKYPMSFVNNDVELLSKRMHRLLGSFPVNQSESILLSQSISTSRTKKNGAKLINSMTKFIRNIHHQEHTTRGLIFKKSIATQEKYYIPVIIACTQAGDVSNLKFILPIDHFSNFNNIVDNKVKDVIYNNEKSFKWKPIEVEEQRRVTNEFQSLLAYSTDSDRVKNTMQHLFSQAGTINNLTE